MSELYEALAGSSGAWINSEVGKSDRSRLCISIVRESKECINNNSIYIVRWKYYILLGIGNWERENWAFPMHPSSNAHYPLPFPIFFKLAKSKPLGIP